MVSKVTTDTAIYAGGCFWGMEYFFQSAPGVLKTTVGYTGGELEQPTYKDVKKGTTGHAEAIEVVYDPTKTNYETLTKLFFEIHDPTQLNRQGVDVGTQYRSMIYYLNEGQKAIAEQLIAILQAKGLKVVTKLEPVSKFWPAEEYHQKYLQKKSETPECHAHTKRF